MRSSRASTTGGCDRRLRRQAARHAKVVATGGPTTADVARKPPRAGETFGPAMVEAARVVGRCRGSLRRLLRAALRYRHRRRGGGGGGGPVMLEAAKVVGRLHPQRRRRQLLRAAL